MRGQAIGCPWHPRKMALLHLLLALSVVGVALYLVTLVPMSERWSHGLAAVTLLGVVLWLAWVFGLMPWH